MVVGQKTDDDISIYAGHDACAPGVHARASRMAFGRMSWPFFDRRVVSMSKIPVRKWFRELRRGDAAVVAPSESEEVAIGDLFARGRGPDFGQHNRRDDVGPPDISRGVGCQQQQSAGSSVGWPGATGQLGADTDDPKFGYRARGPAMLNGIDHEPVQGANVILVLRDDQSHKHVDIKKSNHRGALFRAIQETVDNVDAEGRSADPVGEDRDAALKAYA